MDARNRTAPVVSLPSSLLQFEISDDVHQAVVVVFRQIDIRSSVCRTFFSLIDLKVFCLID